MLIFAETGATLIYLIIYNYIHKVEHFIQKGRYSFALWYEKQDINLHFK